MSRLSRRTFFFSALCFVVVFFPLRSVNAESFVSEATFLSNLFSAFTSLEGTGKKLLAAVGEMDIPSGAKVKVVISSVEPPAEFVALSSAEENQIKSPDVCLDATAKGLFDRKQQPFRADLEKNWKRQAECAQGIATATTLQQKISDLEASIASANAIIQSLTASRQEMSAVTSLKGEAIYTIPAGEDVEKFYTQVTGIASKCVLSAGVPLGTNAATKGNVLTSQTPDKIAQMLAGARQTNKAANKAYTVALAKGLGSLTDAVRQIPTAQIGKLQEALGATFIPVSKGILSKDYGRVESSGDFISVSVSITTGADGKKKKCDTPYFLGGAVGAWFEGTITIDGLSYPNACIPEANIIGKTKEGFDSNITFFQKLKAKYEKELHPLIKQLGALVTAKYNCVAGSTPDTQVASNTQGDFGTIPTPAAKKTLVRKSLSPQPLFSTETSLPVTLSADGATDAVGVAKGEEAEVVWKGDESIVSCRGSWNPTEKLPASGSALVVVNENGTISLSCLDADTKVSTASVIVSAVNPSIFAQVVNAVRGFFSASSGSVIAPTPTDTNAGATPNVSAIRALTERVIALANQRKDRVLSGTATGPVDAELAAVLSERIKQMLALARTNPEAFLAAVIPAETRKLVPQSLQKDVEADTTLTGTLEVYHSDDFEHPENDRYFYFLNTTGGGSSSGKIALKSTIPGVPSADGRIEFYPTEDIPLISGTRIRVRGYQLEQVMVSRVGKTNLQSLSEVSPKVDSVGEQKTLVLLLQYEDSPTPTFTKAEVAERVLKSQTRFYNEQSYDKVSFKGDVVDWFTLSYSGSDFMHGDGQRPRVLYDEDMRKWLSDNDIDLAGYSRIIYLVNHPKVRGGWGSVGKNERTIDGKTYRLSEAWIGVLDSGIGFGASFMGFDSVVSHELGHNLGLWHANGWICSGTDVLRGENCRHVEYANNFDVMGTGAGVYAKHFNAFEKNLLGWLDLGRVVTAKTSGTYTLAPLEKDSGVALLRIDDPITHELFLALDHRLAIGFDQGLDDYFVAPNQKGVFAHTAFPDFPSSATRLLDMTPTSDRRNVTLNAGASFTDPDTGVTLSSVTPSTNGTVSVDVSFGVPQCVHRPFTFNENYMSEAVNAGNDFVIPFVLENKDSVSCTSGEQFEYTLRNAPPSWELKPVSVSGESSAQPGKKTYPNLFIHVAEGTPLGNHPFTIVAMRKSDGFSVEKTFVIPVLKPLRILEISPSKGVVGTKVEIRGIGFGSSNYVWFWSAVGEDYRGNFIPTSKGGIDTLSYEIPKEITQDNGKGAAEGKGAGGVFPTSPGTYFLKVFTNLAFSQVVNFEVLPSSTNTVVILRANNSDGLISVLFGNKVTLSWTLPTNATTCSANWLRDKIDVKNNAGTFVITARFPSTIYTLSCTDSSGKSLGSDSVEIRTDEYIGQAPIQPDLPPRLGSDGKPLPVRKSTDTTGTTITLSSCGEITRAGKYVVDSDVSATKDACIAVHDVSDVQIDCSQHSVVGNPAVEFKNVSGIRIEGCKFDTTENGFLMMKGANVKDAAIFSNVFGTKVLQPSRTRIAPVNIDKGSNINFSRNEVYTVLDLYNLDDTSLVDNIFVLARALSSGESPFVAANININHGRGNKIVGNTIDGGSDGVYRSISTAKGADDGITFSDQIDLVIERNIISNIWDCGIEGGGDIKQGSIVANSIKNAGLCGIGSWYDSSIETTTFADNLVEDSPRIFQFRWVKAIKEPTTILFKDNIFRNNKITNPRLNKQSGGYDDDMFNFTGVKGLIATNNIFSGNDFSKQRHAPYMDPGTLAVDGGTNICKPLGPGFNTSNSPLKCQSSAGTGEAGGVNPSIITTPTITGSSAGAGKVYGGKATISAVVTNTTSGAFETFPGMLQYSSDGVLWHDSLTFDIPTLPAGARADITYTWTVNTGIWWFRICARGICSPESRIEVVARPGDASTPPLSSGKAVIVSSRPVISGRQNGAGKLYEGSMTFAAKVTNIGDGVSRAFKALLQYSKDDVYWSDWVQIDLPPLGPTDTSDINYSWNGGEGLWFVRACDDISDECSASTRFEVVAI